MVIVNHKPVGLKYWHNWKHKIANVLNKVPKSVQPKVKKALYDIWQASSNEKAFVTLLASI
jgi:transposase-like protein